jgi:UDP:flavonoid glycosyltransferase YjiC (YdhE family)
MVAVPNTIEQAVNSFRVEQLSGGLYLPSEQLDAAALRRSADALLADPSIPDGLAKIRNSFLNAGGIDHAVAAINAFKYQHRIA